MFHPSGITLTPARLQDNLCGKTLTKLMPLRHGNSKTTNRLLSLIASCRNRRKSFHFIQKPGRRKYTKSRPAARALPVFRDTICITRLYSIPLMLSRWGDFLILNFLHGFKVHPGTTGLNSVFKIIWIGRLVWNRRKRKPQVTDCKDAYPFLHKSGLFPHPFGSLLYNGYWI